eukprot:CAMPEP_0176364318 /NCGR_PEP_ID=MMETSP0126-20121128/19705_1 /TAXON_ID=141414 ORGANISM="Strombidinopsis acuminatum, Strain SPMC142" /NCGR_SAMPLE_ID=MMETSP0126 /ASSEMBLY_ACC=CAM_ASM_000229 /LENGTH=114 /DNA_ID=CAMNT_0017720909 /DNA_START=1099 /DNA_END=1443 /DNA_ORIENTATION=-
MVVRPKAQMIEKVVQSLDSFKLINAGSKDAYVDLRPKNSSTKIQSVLAHYAMQLSSIFLLEGIICHISINMINKQNNKNPTVLISEIFEQLFEMKEIFENEYLFDFIGRKPDNI